MNKLPQSLNSIHSLLVLMSLIFAGTSAIAQAKPLISRVAVKEEQGHTKIWISDFPVQTKVLLVDAEDNILGVVTTNQFGAAFTQLSKAVYTQVTARTLNGELQVVNTAVIKPVSENEPVAVSEKKTEDKV